MDKLEFSIASEIGNIVKVENFIDYFSDVYNVEPDVFGKISLCVIEAVNNAILYGNKLDSSKHVKFSVYEEEKRLFVAVKDEGEGFDYSYIMAATADRVPCVFIENGKVANYDPSAPIEVSYRKPIEGEPLGKDHPELLFNLKSSHGHDMAIVNGIGRIGYMKGGGKALWKDENIADSITSHAIGFIREHKDEPFFMYFATTDVHVPRL